MATEVAASDSNWVSFVLGPGGLVATGIASTLGFARWYLQWRAKRQEAARVLRETAKADRKRESLRQVLHGISAIYDELNDLVASGVGDRSILVRLHNGGNAPRVGKPLYATVYAQGRSDALPDVKERWSRPRPVDEAYIRMLIELMTQRGPVRQTLIHTEDMRPGILRDTYTDDGVESVHIHEVTPMGDDYFILAVHFAERQEARPDRRSSIGDSANRLRRLLLGPAKDLTTMAPKGV